MMLWGGYKCKVRTNEDMTMYNHGFEMRVCFFSKWRLRSRYEIELDAGSSHDFG